jgi:hypothetical protein
MMYARCSTQPPESLSRDRLPESLLNLGTSNRDHQPGVRHFQPRRAHHGHPDEHAYTTGTVASDALGVVTLSGGDVAGDGCRGALGRQ